MTTTHDDNIAAARTLADAHAVPGIGAQLLWHAMVDIGPREDLGTSPLGLRAIIPIVGGVFWGGSGYETLRGAVLPGGADRQLQRADGVKQLHALYEMRCDDGTVLTILNQVLIDDPVNSGREGARYALGAITVTAPQGPHDWLNRRIIVGTLQPLMPARQAVLIRAYVATPVY